MSPLSLYSAGPCLSQRGPTLRGGETKEMATAKTEGKRRLRGFELWGTLLTSDAMETHPALAEVPEK